MKRLLDSKIISARVYLDFFPASSEERVLNVCCGVGPQAVVYKNRFKEMIGVDVNSRRLEWSEKILPEYGVKNYRTICANVENMPLPTASFDKALAIDIIEHVENPRVVLQEIRRLLKSDGRLLITFPAMHDRYTDMANLIRKVFGRPLCLANRSFNSWDPDSHNQDFPVKEWIRLVKSEGFLLFQSRATTMFPPLHFWGIPKFWFTNKLVNRIDGFFCKLPIIKNFGSAVMAVFVKNDRQY